MTTNRYQKFEPLLKQQRQQRYKHLLQVTIVVVIVMISFLLVGLFDWERLAEGVPSGINLIGKCYRLILVRLSTGLSHCLTLWR